MISAKWDITSQCNLRCKHCSVADMYFNRTRAVAQLTLQQKLEVIDRLADGGVTKLSLLGGEPLMLGDNLFSLLCRARDREINVTIVTNGLLLTSEVSRRLVDDGLANLVVSIESPRAEIHNQIRGKRTFERMMTNVAAFQRIRAGAQFPKLTVNTVLSRPNRPTFADMIPFCQDIGADYWSALTLNYIGSADQNLDRLALSQEEHTEVALDIGLRLKSGEIALADLKINFAIVCPLIWEYLCKRYELSLPQPEICCSAATSLVYLSPAGDLYVCDRVHSSGYDRATLATTTMQPTNLLSETFDGIWKSKQFTEMFEFVARAQTYSKFEPCNRCKYLNDGTCNPCPLQAYREGPVRYAECLKAEAYLGDISKRSKEPKTRWEEAHAFEPAIWPILTSSWFEAVRDACPVKADGFRCSVQRDDLTLLIHPQTVEAIKLNAIATQIWESMSGTTTTKDVLGQAEDIYRGAAQVLGVEVSEEASAAVVSGKILPFIRLLEEKGFIRFESGRPAH